MVRQNRNKTKHLLLSGIFAALTAIGALIKIPMYPVPISLQTFFMLLAGNVLGPYYGSLSQLTYLIIGLIGLPVFAEGGGPTYILKPTFGYLVAFPIAAGIVGYLVNQIQNKPYLGFWSKDFILVILINLIGVITVLLFGITYLYLNLNYITGRSIPLREAIMIGALIFLPGEIIKMFLASFIGRNIKKNLQYLIYNNCHDKFIF